MSKGGRDDPIVRLSARVILLDPRDRVLLLCFGDSRARDSTPFWSAPGGMIESGETHEQADRRELAEETGIRAACIGPWVWNRRHLAPWAGRWYDWRERYFLARTAETHAHARGMTKAEQRDLVEQRWWDIDELAASNEDFAPRRLADLLRPLLAGRIPDEPIDAGV